MSILVCAATATEVTACEKGLGPARLRDGFEVLKTGVGPARARATLSERLAATGRTPRLIVSTGFAGSLDARIPVGTWITAAFVARSDDAGVRRVDVSRLFADVPGTVSCGLVSSSELVLGKSGEERLAVDMESAELAELSERARIPFLVLRFVTDSPENPLPAFVAPFTAALSARGFRERFTQGARGLRSAIGDPQGVVHLVKEGASWSQSLSRGWAERANFVERLLT
jgi:nucleoside phosphorylase